MIVERVGAELVAVVVAVAEGRPLVLTAAGGSFTGGRVRLAVHWWELRLPA